MTATVLFLAAGCNIPSLETPECIAARPVVSEFYSQHFDGEMKLSAEKLERLRKFLTPEFASLLDGTETENDVFTTNDTNYPRAFRVTGCETVSPENVKMTVLIFWRDTETTEQKEIKADVENRDGRWLINNIER